MSIMYLRFCIIEGRQTNINNIFKDTITNLVYLAQKVNNQCSDYNGFHNNSALYCCQGQISSTKKEKDFNCKYPFNLGVL